MRQASTSKSLSEALIFASINPQYDDRLFIELQDQYMKIPSSNLGRTCCVQKLLLTCSPHVQSDRDQVLQTLTSYCGTHI